MENIVGVKEFNLYKDIQTRTGGEIYLGVVGPVRSGKSTFIKRFMDLLVLPNMEDEHARERTKDELPQSASGRTIMTTEPKFIPKEAAIIQLSDDVEAKIRLIDCVGFMVEGATGHTEEGSERLVKTPWFDYEIPFTQAAEIGTQKVITDHSTIGIVMTCDGSFGEIPRESYIAAEEKTIKELKKLQKPFVILLNSQKPFSNEALELAKELELKYAVAVCLVNCEQLRKDDIFKIMEKILYEFPIGKIEFFMPKWVEMLPANHKIKDNFIQNVRGLLKNLNCAKDIIKQPIAFDGEYAKRIKTDQVDLATGCIRINIEVDEQYYYENVSELTGENIKGEYELISMVKDLSKMKREYEKSANAIQCVKFKGYGVVTPEIDDIVLDEPVLIKHGNKFGVKIKAQSPSIHMIKANIETEIAPIVGSEQQANDLIQYIKQNQEGEEGIWNTNIFGKSIGDMVKEGIQSKISIMNDDSQLKLQETMEKIVNDNNGGMVCIII